MLSAETTMNSIRQLHPNWDFPDFKEKTYFNKQNKYCICVFVINEGEKIQKQLGHMSKFRRQIDIIVADGGSTDGSLDDATLKSAGVRTLLTKIGKGKLSAQMRMAFAWALNEGYEGVVVVDGNGKDDISAIPNFIELLDQGYDHIQGSRFIPGGQAINTPLARELALHMIHAPLISLASKKRHTDTTNGFRGYSSKLLGDNKIDIFRSIFQTYELHYYLAIESSRRRNFRTAETPVTRAYPARGKTPTKISPIRGNLGILMILARAVAGRYRTKN